MLSYVRYHTLAFRRRSRKLMQAMCVLIGVAFWMIWSQANMILAAFPQSFEGVGSFVEVVVSLRRHYGRITCAILVAMLRRIPVLQGMAIS